jgi:hypothetical protein
MNYAKPEVEYGVIIDSPGSGRAFLSLHGSFACGRECEEQCECDLMLTLWGGSWWIEEPFSGASQGMV